MPPSDFRFPINLEAGSKLAMLLEINRSIARSEVEAVVEIPEDATVRIAPLGGPDRLAPRNDGEWATVFAELERFFAELAAQEAEAGVVAEVHVFGCAPLPVMLYTGFRLGRRRMTAYQQDRDSGTWTAAFSTTDESDGSEFLTVDGLPAVRQPGRGDVFVSLGVTQEVSAKAEAYFQRSTALEPLATVRAVPTAGVSPQAIRSPADASSSARQLRQALDTIHTRLPGTERVLLAMSCSASLACALGTSINPNAQHALVLHNYRPEEGYVPVYEIRAVDPRPTRRPLDAEDTRNAVATLEQVAEVYGRLTKWIAVHAELADAVGGADFVGASVQCTPKDGEEFEYDYMESRWLFDSHFALTLRDLRASVPADDWAECLRLFFVHEGFHIKQRLTSINYQGIGRAGFVLEALDYDADVKSVEACLQWRRENRRDDFEAFGELGTLAQILGNILRMARIFNPELNSGSAQELVERHLRRFLIWTYQLGRARKFAAGSDLGDFRLGERVFVELPGLPARADFRAHYFRPHVGVTDAAVNASTEIAVYHHGALYRKKDVAWVTRLLQALRTGDLDELATTWAVFFDEHPTLVGRGR